MIPLLGRREALHGLQVVLLASLEVLKALKVEWASPKRVREHLHAAFWGEISLGCQNESMLSGEEDFSVL
jgi:hypothetical protein